MFDRLRIDYASGENVYLSPKSAAEG